MLNYSARPTPRGLKVAFHATPNFVAMGTCVMLAAASTAVALHLPFQPIGDSFGRLLEDLALTIVLLLLLLCFTVCVVILFSNLVTKTAVFRQEGIRVTNNFLGFLPVYSRFVYSDYIYWFGVDHFRHSRSTVLKFAVSGRRSWVVLASDVAEWEGARFLEFLSQHGFGYRTQSEP